MADRQRRDRNAQEASTGASTATAPDKAIVVGLAADNMSRRDRSTEESLDELAALLQTSGATAAERVLQHRKSPEPRTFIGEGKAKEIKEIIDSADIKLAVFDNELSPSQTRALSQDLGVRVIDRSTLILDIFAQRARTKEGRLQVELAQYQYLLPRLTGMWTHLVRQTASGASRIGTRGPGETQLETDRRHIRLKIQKLERDLEDVRRARSVQRKSRERNQVPVLALVGYTNAGKSTLLNRLTDAGIHTGDRLFDTLDTTTRRLRLPNGEPALVSDTVGFINRLPHHLVEAFKATLEELLYADVLIHVIDASNPNWPDQADVVNRLIADLGAASKPVVEAYNKCDLCEGGLPVLGGERSVRISARTGDGVPDLLSACARLL